MLLQSADALPQARDPRLKFVPFNHPVRIAVDQAGQPAAELPQLGLNLITSPRLGRFQPALVCCQHPRGVGPQRTDRLPDGRVEQIRTHLGVRTDPLAPKPVGVGANTPIVGIGPRAPLGGFGTDGLAILGILTLGTYNQSLQQIAGAALTLPCPLPIFG